MEISAKVVDALELAAHRLDEPEVRKAYDALLSLVDARLGGDFLKAANGAPLTEPQRVFIAYGLKHIGAAHGLPLGRAAERLIAALSGESDEEQADAAQNESTAPPETAQPTSTPQFEWESSDSSIYKLAPEPARKPAPVVRIRQTVRPRSTPPPPPTLPEEPETDEDDTSVLIAVRVPPPNEVEYDVYLSYSRRNAEVMRRLRADLRAAGLTVWTDENLQVGTPSWQEAMENAMRHSKTMVAIMSPDAKGSEWVERELSAAKALKVPIFPVLARGDQRSAFSSTLNGYQYVDIRKEPDYHKSVLKLREALKTYLHSLRERSKRVT